MYMGIYLIAIYLFNHILVSLIRGYLRAKKYRLYYESIYKTKGVVFRGVKRRILKPTTFLLATFATLIEIVYLSLIYESL